MSKAALVTQLVLGVVLLAWGLASDAGWFRWLLIGVGALVIVLQGFALIRRSRGS